MKKKILLIGLLLCCIGCQKQSNINTNPNATVEEPIYNTEEDVISNKEYDGIVFSNITYYYDGEYTNVEFKVTNNKKKSIKLNYFDVVVKDKNNKEIGTFSAYYDKEINSGDSTELSVSLDADFTKAYHIEFNLKELEEINN